VIDMNITKFVIQFTALAIFVIAGVHVPIFILLVQQLIGVPMALEVQVQMA
jgi:hypothetical protein